MRGVAETRKAPSYEEALPFNRKGQEFPVLLLTPNSLRMPCCYPISNRLYVTASTIFPTVCESVQIVVIIGFYYNK